MKESTRSGIAHAARATGLDSLIAIGISLAIVAVGCRESTEAPAGSSTAMEDVNDSDPDAILSLPLSPALARVVERARAGDPEAQLAIGDLFEAGDGLPRDDANARTWYRRAAVQGLAGAQYALGVMLFEGRGGPEELGQGVHWLREAAAAGHLEAMNSLGIVYSMGRGVDRDPAAAMQWFERAAEGGHRTAQLSLGSRLAVGFAGPVDLSRAAHWFREAADGGLAAAQWRYGLALANGEGVPADDLEAYVWLNLSGRVRSHDATTLLEGVASRLTEEQRLEARRRMGAWRARQSD